METNKLTYEQAMARFMAAKRKKQECVERLKEELIERCENRTGKKPTHIFVL